MGCAYSNNAYQAGWALGYTVVHPGSESWQRPVPGGQVTRNPVDRPVGLGDIGAPSEQVFENLGIALRSAAAGFENLMRIM